MAGLLVEKIFKRASIVRNGTITIQLRLAIMPY